MQPSSKSLLLEPTTTEIIKSRDFGRVRGSLTRNQRVAFAAFIKTAYTQMLEEKCRRKFNIKTRHLLEEMGIEHRNLFGGRETADGGKLSLESSLTSLMTKILEWRYKDAKGNLRVQKSTMLSGFDMGHDTTEFSFSPWLEERILCYGNAYILQMPILASFQSGYAVALYEQIQQRLKFESWDVTIDDFRELMGVEADEYPRIQNLRVRVIDPAIREINDKTSLLIAYEQKKDGKKIIGFHFSWMESKKKEKENPKQGSLFDTPKNFIGHRIHITDRDGVDHKLTILGFSKEDGYFVIDVEGGQVKTRTTSDVELTALLREKVIKE